jgi:hypothetical protein
LAKSKETHQIEIEVEIEGSRGGGGGELPQEESVGGGAREGGYGFWPNGDEETGVGVEEMQAELEPVEVGRVESGSISLSCSNARRASRG